MKQTEIIFMDQLLHHRSVASQIEQTRLSWNSRSSWFPYAQKEQYSQISSLYADCLKKYGEKNFDYYANRNRLHKEYIANTRDKIYPNVQALSMEHFKGYKVPKTSNGEYGSLRPSKLFFCVK